MIKLKNKKTGEIQELTVTLTGDIVIEQDGERIVEISSLAELNEELEDYEEPKEYWCIDADGELLCEPSDDSCKFDNNCKEIGNYFETEEEAKKVVEKLKAWKRLKDNGFKFEGMDGLHYTIYYDEGKSYETHEQCEQAKLDLELLFGGEE